MAIEINDLFRISPQELIYRNRTDIDELQEKVSYNENDIEELQNNVEADVTEINQQLARALKTPISIPTETELVAVDDTNAQVMIGLGDGLAIEDGKLTVTGGGGGGGGGGASSDILIDVVNDLSGRGDTELSFSWMEGAYTSYNGKSRTLLIKGLADASNPYLEFTTSNDDVTVDYNLYDQNGSEIDGGYVDLTGATNTISLPETTKSVYLQISYLV